MSQAFAKSTRGKSGVKLLVPMGVMAVLRCIDNKWLLKVADDVHARGDLAKDQRRDQSEV